MQKYYKRYTMQEEKQIIKVNKTVQKKAMV